MTDLIKAADALAEEDAAKIIYDAMAWAYEAGSGNRCPAWVEHSNSHAQMKARAASSRIFTAYRQARESADGVKVKPQKQLIQHDPANGKWGDCYRTCVAVILGVDADQIPHVCAKGWENIDDLDGLVAMRKHLRSRGFGISKSVYSGDLSWFHFKNWMEKFNPDTAFIVTGMAGRGVNHCVVMIGGLVVCDPISGSANQDALTGPAEVDGEKHWWVEVITPLADDGTSDKTTLEE